MHSAPAVAYPVRRSPAAGQFLILGHSLCALAMAMWFLNARSGWPIALGIVCCGIACVWAWAAWRAMPIGTLAWDGAAWHYTPGLAARSGDPAGCPQLVVALDWQRYLLLQWPGRSAQRWFWLDQSSQPLVWPALRRAVYSPARNAGEGALPGTASAAP
ncbi:MAG: hypothetical protein ACKVOO_09510 [Burkholderiaceae bacterium]